MKSYQPASWDKLSVEKSSISSENENLTTKLLNQKQKRGNNAKECTLSDLIKKGNNICLLQKTIAKMLKLDALSMKFSLTSIKP